MPIRLDTNYNLADDNLTYHAEDENMEGLEKSEVPSRPGRPGSEFGRHGQRIAREKGCRFTRLSIRAYPTRGARPNHEPPSRGGVLPRRARAATRQVEIDTVRHWPTRRLAVIRR